MYMLETLQQVLVLAFLVACMLSIGMQTRLDNLRALAASRGFLARVLLANFLVIPLVGVAVVSMIPMQPPLPGALLLLACTPGGVASIQFTSQIKGSASMAGVVLFILSFLAVFVSPLILQMVFPANVQLEVPYGRVLLFLAAFLLLPLLAGMLLLRRAPSTATKLARPVALLGLVVFVAFMVTTASARQAAAVEIGPAAVGGMLLFIFVSMAVGWFLGGPTREFRRILASATSMRNAALCLAFVAYTSPGHAVIIPLIAFSLLMVPPNMLFTVFWTIQEKRKERKAAQ